MQQTTKHVLKRAWIDTLKPAEATNITHNCNNFNLARKGKTTIKHYKEESSVQRLEAHPVGTRAPFSRDQNTTTYN